MGLQEKNEMVSNVPYFFSIVNKFQHFIINFDRPTSIIAFGGKIKIATFLSNLIFGWYPSKMVVKYTPSHCVKISHISYFWVVQYDVRYKSKNHQKSDVTSGHSEHWVLIGKCRNVANVIWNMWKHFIPKNNASIDDNSPKYKQNQDKN